MKYRYFDSRGLTHVEWIEKVISTIDIENLQNFSDLFNDTILHSAVKTNNLLEIVKYLIGSGCTIDARNDLGQTPLMLAIKNHCEDVIDILLEAGSDIHIQDYLGRSALEMLNTTRLCKINVIQRFIKIVERDFPSDNEKIASIILEYGWPLHYVVLLGNLDVMKLLLQYNKYSDNINENEYYSETALHVAVLTNDRLKITKYLIEAGCRVDAQNHDGITPLMLAIQNNCEDVVGILLEAGSDIHIQDYHGRSALEMFNATRWCNIDVIQRFINIVERDFPNDNEKIASIILEYGWPLYYVMVLENADITRLLLKNDEYSDSINDLNGDGRTALHVAVRLIDVDNVELLLDINANMYIVDDFDYSPLAYLCMKQALKGCSKKRLEIMKIFIEKMYSVSECMSDSEYVEEIHKLLATQKQDIIKLLLQTDIPLNRTNFQDQNAVHVLAMNSNPGVIEELTNKKFIVNLHDMNLMTPLMIAAEYGNVRALEFLLNAGADIEARESSGLTALVIAYEDIMKYNEDGCVECVQILLERGANAQVQTYDEGEPTVFDEIPEDQNYESVWRIIAHLALQEALGMPITQLIRSRIESDKRFKDYFESSKQQLSSKVYKSLTLFDLLSNVTDKVFERYMRNEQFVLKLEHLSKEIVNFLYYNTILQKRLKKAINIIALKSQAADIICRIMQTNYNRFPLIADDIVSYLEQQDMENLINISVL